ncbi:hypothetical protein SAY87_015855 [Trapa incisa]|uniref:Uncharacterized protein n=1 Tax=Trapa incisa TaxID=236973 RepID=A0AAN7QTZ9_9MYRT|nr:hypothetical protein SAY87_015855 [Trapa incisa]
MDPYPWSPPQLPSYNPQVTWWMPPPLTGEHDSSGHTPTWVIVGLVAIVLISVALLFMFFKKRTGNDKKPCGILPIEFKPPKPTGESKNCAGTVDPPRPVVLEKEQAAAVSIKDLAMVPQFHHPQMPVSKAGNCIKCGGKSGLYGLTYKCSKCIFKCEAGMYIQYPEK